jgi:kumamolisin
MIVLQNAYRAQLVYLCALSLILLLPLASLASCTQPEPPFTSINLGIPAAALQSPVKGKLPDSTELHVGITFKIDPRLLQQADQQRPQPGQPSKPGRIPQGLGVDNGLYQKIKGFFQGIDLQLSKLRTYMSFQAKAGTLARLLQTTFVVHQYKGRTFYAPAPPPKVPTDFAKTIAAITGLDNYSLHPKHALNITYPSYQHRSLAAEHSQLANAAAQLLLRSQASCKAYCSQSGRTKGEASQVSRNGALDCSPGDQTLTLGDVAGAYGYNQLWQRGVLGENMTINLVEIDGSYKDDIQNYLNCIHFKGHLSFVDVDGHPSDVQGESTLDIQMVAGLAPAASIVVYQTDGNANDDPWTQVNDELQQIINADTNNANAGSVVSISLGIDEGDISSDDVRALDSSLQQLTQVEHMTVFVASGDCAAFADETFLDLSVSFPASDPWSVAVGGTKLSVNDQHQRTGEVAWSEFPNIFHCHNSWGSGGGNSSMFRRPDWQNANGVNNKDSKNVRQVPDISAVADNLAVYFQGAWEAVGGTSAAAPIWAAGQALVNEDTIQHLGTFGYSPRLYYAVANKSAGANAYFDVTRGNNLYYHATPGWDYPTGLGTPNLASFDQAVSNTLG